jgi:hypothetical protein
MGFLITGDTEMQVYLTEYGKETILTRTFNPRYFTINDSDVNYVWNAVLDRSVADISGDQSADNVFALSKYRNIKGSIIRNVSGSAPIPVPGATTISETIVTSEPLT